MNFVIKLEDQVITSLRELGEKMYLYEDASEKLLTSPKFLNFLKEYDEKKFNQLIELNHRVREHEEFIFLAQYIFSPIMNIRHHGYQFNSFEELGKQIIEFGPDVDIYLKDFLKYKLLSQYMKLMGFNKTEAKIYNKVIELEGLFEENENKAYFLLGFTLSRCGIITYCGRSYKDVNLFFKEMALNKNVTSFFSLISKSQYVVSWLTYLGYGEQVDKYQSIINLVDDLEESYERRKEISKMVK
jgi:hypothetical protein